MLNKILMIFMFELNNDVFKEILSIKKTDAFLWGIRFLFF
jgi:hypothetical protein